MLHELVSFTAAQSAVLDRTISRVMRGVLPDKKVSSGVDFRQITNQIACMELPV